MINDENASFIEEEEEEEEEGYLLLNLKYLRAVIDVEGDASWFEAQLNEESNW